MATSTSAQSTAGHSVPIVVLGTDAVLAAQPGTAVQLAHACLKAGFANVIPASWGDELIASVTLRRLADAGPGPAIACSCPIVAHRLLSASADLQPVLLPFVPPPVAVSRYLHVLARPSRARITYVGNCPGAIDDSIDIRMSPDALISMLVERHILIEDQPRVFESIIPADRRRFRSQPGGLPAADAVWAVGGARRLVEVGHGDLVATIAQHVIANDNVLIDAAMALGCLCSGALATGGREAVVAIEPPRAGSPVIDEGAPIQLELRVPAASRTPADVMAISPLSTPSVPHPALPLKRPHEEPATFPLPQANASWESTRRQTPPAGLNAAEVPPGARQADSRERRALPRAYIVRRRPSPRSTPVVPANPSRQPSVEETQAGESGHSSNEAAKTQQSDGVDKSDEEDSEREIEAPSDVAQPVDRLVEVQAETPVESPEAMEQEVTVDLLPLPRPATPAAAAPPALDVTSPLRVVQNGSTRDHADVLEAAESETDSPRILSATSSAARATRTAVRDLRDAFMVTVSSPGETVTRSQPPDGVTGSIGGVTPLFNEPMTVVRVRNVVLVMLGFVALIVVLVAGAAILIERRLNPPPAATAPINP